MQTRTRRTVPPMTARTLWRLGSQRRLVATFEWLTLKPVVGPFPQLAQTLDISENLFDEQKTGRHMIRSGAMLDKEALPAGLTVAVAGNTRTAFWRWDGFAPQRAEALATSELLALEVPWPTASGPLVLVSVVPPLTALLRERHPEVLVVTAADAPLPVAYRPPGALGADRLVDALAAMYLVGAPAIAVDCGTATTVTVVDREGTLRGGAIMPGLSTAAAALGERTAQLPLVTPGTVGGPWGEDTETSIRTGLVVGHAGAIRALVERARRGLGAEAPVLLTGGWGELVAAELGYPYHADLTALGAVLYAAWKLG